MKKLADIVLFEEEVAWKGRKSRASGEGARYKDFSLFDGLVLAARSLGDRLLTFVTDFSGVKNCIFLD